MSRRSTAIEGAFVIGLLALGFFVGSFASRHYTQQPLFYQGEFGPAVMVAAGRGFVNPVAQPGSPLAEFLALGRSSLDPADLAQVPTTGVLNQFQLGTRYLMLAVGYCWKVAGISWAGVSGLAALLYALSVVACYAICRVWLSRPLAAAGAVFICFSPLHLQQVPNLRDYSKAPFILWAVLLVIVVSLRPLSRRMLVVFSAVCGVVVGIGLGFKMDVTVMAPIFLVSVFAFRDRRPWTGLAAKGLAAGAFLLAVVISAAPILSRLSSGGSNAFHVILLGYSDWFDPTLGITRSAYHFLPFYSDVYMIEVVRERAARFTAEPVLFPSAAYDAAGRAYWLEIVRHFPADILTRALAAANSILNLPFSGAALDFLTPPANGANPVWNLLTNKAPRTLRVGAVFDWLAILNGWGLAFGVVLVAAAGASSVRLGLFATWMILALTGYSSLQFAGRHFFHLEIIPVFGLLVAVDLLVRRRLPGWRPAVRFATAIVVLALATLAPLLALRAYQTTHLRRLFQEYVDSPRHSVETTFADTGHGTLHLQWDEAGARSAALRAPTADYYVVEFDGAPGQSAKLLGFRDTGVPPDYSKISLSSDPGVNRIFVPAYGAPRTFDGLELSASLKSRVRGVYRIDHPERLPLLLTMRLHDDWRQRGLYQTLRVEGRGDPDSSVQLLESMTTAGSSIPWLDRVESLATIPKADNVGIAYSTAVRVTPNGIEMDGAADTRSSYLLGFKSVNVVKTPAALIVTGHITDGGAAFGLLKDNRWYRNLSARNPGDFVAILEITESGTYVPIVTNATSRDRDRNRFVLSRFGIVEANSEKP